MATEYIKCTSDEHWKHLRSLDVTSTEAAALFGCGKWVSEYELYHNKKNGEILEIDINKVIKKGIYLEPGIAEWAANDNGWTVKPFKEYATDKYSRMGSSFDYEIVGGLYDGWILEIKTVQDKIYKNDWLEDEAPAHIEIQVQHQLELTQRPGAIICCLTGYNSDVLKFIFRERDPIVGGKIRKRIHMFWNDIEIGNVPDVNWSADSQYIIDNSPFATDMILDATTSNEALMEMLSYEQCLENEKSIKEQKTQAKAKLLKIAGEHSKIIGPTGYIFTCGSSKGSPGKIITQEMVGTLTGARKGGRRCSLRKIDFEGFGRK